MNSLVTGWIVVLGEPKKPYMVVVVVPKTVAVIPHQGRNILTRARMLANTPRRLTLLKSFAMLGLPAYLRLPSYCQSVFVRFDSDLVKLAV